jgi:DNA-binding XRE family transcriptional regulator
VKTAARNTSSAYAIVSRKMGWTQEATARHLDVTVRTVQHWEAGKTSAGAESGPPLTVRFAMAALMADPKLKAWPE